MALRTRSGMRKPKKGGDARAHGIAKHVGSFDAEMIEEPPRVLRHDRAGIGFGIVEFLAGAVAPVVERNDPKAVHRQEPDPARAGPVCLHIRGEAVDEQDRVPLALDRIGDLNAIRREKLHARPSRPICPDVGNRLAEVKHTVNTLGSLVMKND